MAETLGALLAQQAGEITGRERERAQLRRLLEPDGPVVGYVHGLAGVGKTTLLHAFAAEAREAGAVVLELDGHVVPATQREFLLALGGSSVEEAAAAVGARGERVVLILDTFELLAMLDHWLCRTMIPALPVERARGDRRPQRAVRALAQLRAAAVLGPAVQPVARGGRRAAAPQRRRPR